MKNFFDPEWLAFVEIYQKWLVIMCRKFYNEYRYILPSLCGWTAWQGMTKR